ncbi:hypothetical protein HQQ82_00790 [Rathayibacter sp. VKM Ac-2856]|uniref:hypothetical protein n=1 Tax=unclassified Rathayibacter TaxID=2609250 RepID=UPI001564D7A2|nr:MULTISPECIES: hypothetical protein [unclassified Rathayibacter]NQX03333.1 hypothetical protein [Rathayibacter sp. VKM Ac-2858]NQX18501.1 hypothetical protein [Rathayibacter sp. VKM Ac-2856]
MVPADDDLSEDGVVGGVEGLLEESKRFGSYSVEGREVVEAYPPQVVHIVYACFLKRAGGWGADVGKRSRFHESEPTNRTTVLVVGCPDVDSRREVDRAFVDLWSRRGPPATADTS